MSAIVSFTDGSDWSIGRRDWNKLQERTQEKLRAEGHENLQWLIRDYGVAFDLQSKEARGPMARALLAAAREVQEESGSREGWDVAEKGPYFGELVGLLEHELAASS